jgi:hypothetical protein
VASGPPIAVPSGDAVRSTALRAASIGASCCGGDCACMSVTESATNGPWIAPPSVKHARVTPVGTSNPNGSSERPADHDPDRHGPERQLPERTDREPAEHRADAEHHPVEAEQRARCVHVVGHAERQGDLDRV